MFHKKDLLICSETLILLYAYKDVLKNRYRKLRILCKLENKVKSDHHCQLLSLAQIPVYFWANL